MRSSTDIDALVVTRSTFATVASSQEEQVRGMVEAWGARPAGVPVIVLIDNPVMPDTTTTCLEQHGPADAGACAQPRDVALGHDLQRDAAARTPGSHVIDLSDLYCTPTTCEAVIGGAVVYRPDGNHFTAVFARTLAPYLGDGIETALAPK